jgi:hypothetical protein
VRQLSKSKLFAFRQCRRRLWLETHHPELQVDSSAAEASFGLGNRVGATARKLYDPKGSGVLIDVERGFDPDSPSLKLVSSQAAHSPLSILCFLHCEKADLLGT